MKDQGHMLKFALEKNIFFQANFLTLFWSHGMVRLAPQLCALGPSSQRRRLSLLDTVVTGTTTFCPQLIMLRLRAHNLKRQKSQRVRQTEFNLLSSMPASLMGVVVGNYKMSVEDPDEVKWSSCIRDGGWSFDFTSGMDFKSTVFKQLYFVDNHIHLKNYLLPSCCLRSYWMTCGRWEIFE